MELALKLYAHLFPSRCVVCGKTIKVTAVNSATELCQPCYQALPFNLSACLRCALPLADDTGHQRYCGRCIRQRPYYDYAHSVFRYEDDIIALVHQLKFSEKITYARTIGEILNSAFHGSAILSAEQPDCLLPVPLHTAKLRQRGYNQAIEIARVISKKQAIPIEYNAVTRRRYTVSQTGLNAKQRRKNIHGAFTVQMAIAYRHVLIIDDVVTTASTVNELAKVLKKAKVERVGVLSIARAPNRR